MANEKAASSGSGQPQPRKLTPRQEALRRRQAIRQRNRLIVIGLISLVAVAAVGLIIFAINQPTKFDNVADKAVLDNAIPLDAGLNPVDERFTKGANGANVTVTEYGDYQCPACRTFFEGEEKQLVNDYVKTGKVKMVFAVYPFLDSNLPAQESHVAAEASYCAADQKRFWDFHDALYSNQLSENTGKLTPDRMKQLAAASNLDKDAFNRCMDAHRYKSEVAQARTEVAQKGVNSTPSFAVNGQLVVSATPNNRPSYDEIKAAIEKALAANKK